MNLRLCLFIVLPTMVLASCTTPPVAGREDQPSAPVVTEAEALQIAQQAFAAIGWHNAHVHDMEATLATRGERIIWVVQWTHPAAPAGGPIGECVIDARTGTILYRHAAGTC